MVRLAPARRRRPAPLHPIRLRHPALCQSARNSRHAARRRPRLRRRLRARARRHRALARTHEPHQGNQRRRFRRRRSAGRDHARTCRKRSRSAACFIRPTPPAARTISSAATSPPTPAGRAASNTASPAITSSASKSFSPTAPSSGSAGARTKTRPASTCTACSSARKALLGVITEATLKLIPLPPFRANLAVGFGSMKTAVARVAGDFGRRLSALRAGTGR